jgi:hypothetical protein
MSTNQYLLRYGRVSEKFVYREDWKILEPVCEQLQPMKISVFPFVRRMLHEQSV